MAYQQGTVLARKEPFEEPEDDTSPDQTPYNEVVVIGSSPVQANVRAEEWAGQQGDNISVRPASFGEVVDLPQGRLEQEYQIVSVPEVEKNLTHTIEQIQPGPSPEDNFRTEASESGAVKSEERQETPLGWKVATKTRRARTSH